MIHIRHITICLLMAISAHAGEIVLMERAAPYHSIVRLGDVAEVRGVEDSLRYRLAQAPLMPAPSQQQFVRAQNVRDLLAAQGFNVDDFTFSGANAVAVQALAGQPNSKPVKTPQTGYRVYDLHATTNVPQTRLVPLGKAAEERVRGEIAAAIDAVVRATPEGQFLQAVEVGAGEPLMRAWLQAAEKPQLTPAAAIAAGARSFRLKFATGEEFQLLAELAETRPVLTATRPLLKGDVITAADFELAPAPVDLLKDAQLRYFADPEEVIGQEASRSIRPGDILSDKTCTTPLMVRRGEQITIVSGGEGIVIRMAAQAERDGRQGELIPVRPNDRKEVLMGRVTGRGEVAVLAASPSISRAVAQDLRNSSYR